MTDTLPWKVGNATVSGPWAPNRRGKEIGRERGRIWFRTYKRRIGDGLESCRNCGHSDGYLEFAHLIPYARGGQLKFDNITILCALCNQKQGSRIWSHLRSLHDEETTAPLGQRWAFIAWKAAQRAKGTVPLPMTPEREALVPRVMEVLIANGPDGDPLSPGEVCDRLGLDPEQEILVFKALRASRKRGYALLSPDTRSGTYLCVPGATVPELVTPERTP
jgi:hypothetical protein